MLVWSDFPGKLCFCKGLDVGFGYAVSMRFGVGNNRASAAKAPVLTYETRIRDDEVSGVYSSLSAYAELYTRVQRKLFADVAAGRSVVSLKKEYLRRYGIPARMFNGLRVSLEGKVDAVRAGMTRRRASLGRQISRAEKRIARCERGGRWGQVHHKRRRLANLRLKLASLEADIEAERVRLCFGSKRLWRKQFDLEANGYGSHEGWVGDWQSARSSEFFVLGSRDETAGCQLCVATVADDGTLTLRLRMPDSLTGEHGKYLVIEGMHFNHGHYQVLTALGSNAKYRQYRLKHGEQAAWPSGLGQVLSYRFKRDEKGWRVFVSTRVMEVPVVTDRRSGAIGVDLNVDHLAVCETDSSGNYFGAFSVPLVTYGKSKHQAEALVGDAVARVVEHSRSVGKPVVIEKLDFREKKSSLEGESRCRSRMLSSFAYGKVKSYFLSRGYREGVEVYQVNPAYSSVMGRVKFMERYGLSVHQAAALVLARRLLGCSEGIPRLQECPADSGVRVTFFVPARKRVKHVWTLWGAVLGQLRPALAAQHRLGGRIRPSNPVRAGPLGLVLAETGSVFSGEIPGRSRFEQLGRRRG